MGAIFSGIGSLVGGITGAGAAKDAAQIQANAANNAAQLQYKASQDANSLQQSEFNTQQQNLQPWLQAGTYGLGELQREIQNGQTNAWSSPSGLYNGPTNSGINTQMSNPTPFNFDASTLTSDPGYQFQLQQGQQALQNQQSALGISGGAAAKALDRYNQDYAGTAYNTAYQRALGTNQQNYAQNFNTGQANITNAESDFANNFNRGLTETENNYNVGQNNTTTNFNRLATLAGVGQTATGQLGTLGANYASNVGNNLMSAASAAGNYGTQAGNAGAAGTVGAANAWSSALTGIGNAVSYPGGITNDWNSIMNLFGRGTQNNDYYGDSGSNFY